MDIHLRRPAAANNIAVREELQETTRVIKSSTPHPAFIRELMETRNRSASFSLRLIAAWALVGIPLGWGVWQVFQKSLDLFR